MGNTIEACCENQFKDYQELNSRCHSSTLQTNHSYRSQGPTHLQEGLPFAQVATVQRSQQQQKTHPNHSPGILQFHLIFQEPNSQRSN